MLEPEKESLLPHDKLEHLTYWRTVNKPGVTYVRPVFMFLYTVLCFAVAIGLDTNNVGINYTQTLFKVSLGCYVGAMALYMICLGIYVSHVHFCTPDQKINHFYVVFVTSSSLAATILWVDVYACELNVYTLAAAGLLWFVTWIGGIAAFMEGHLRSCPDYDLHLATMTNGTSNWLTAFIILFNIVWIAYLILTFFYIEDLYIETPARDNITCVSNL